MPFPRRLLPCLALVPLLFLLPAGARAQAGLEAATFRLDESTQSLELWTCPPAEKVFRDTAVPSATGSGVKVYAAGNEFEPFVIVARPLASGSVTVSCGDFGAGITQLAYEVRYVTVTQATDMRGSTGGHPDPLWPLADGASVALTAGQNTAFWFTLSVPPGTPAGDYFADVTIDGVAVPVTLHVFGFDLPGEVSLGSSLGFSQQQVLNAYGAGFSDWQFLDKWRQFLIDHRLTPQVPLWPGGVTYGGGQPLVGYNCGTRNLSDTDGIWGFEVPAARWLGGAGLFAGNFATAFNDGTGFPSFEAMGLGNNDPSQDPRPSSFCGEARGAGDWYTGNNNQSAYNQAWFGYVGALAGYLDGLAYLDRSYALIASEPFDQADYDAIAWYSRYLDAAAPGLRLMVAEEPKPQIHDHPDYVQDGQVDIWLTYFGSYDPEAAAERAALHGETSWLYYLPATVAPYFTPFTLDHPGLDSRLTGWLFWKYRVSGLYHDQAIDWLVNPWTTPAPTANNGFTNLLYPPSTSNTPIAYGSNGQRPVPSMRLELLRDGFEDYEYLRVLNGGALPAAGVIDAADAHVGKVIGGLASYVQDAGFVGNLRRLVGAYIGGEIAAIPDIQPTSPHPRAQGAPGDYHLNFQDPAGQPLADPLVVGGDTYLKVGGAAYDAVAGYGWYSPPEVSWAYGWVPAAANDLLRSVMYSDYARPAVFEFDLPPGTYEVTVSTGWAGRSYEHGRIVVEGVPLVDDETVTGNITRTATISIADSRLTMEMGVRDWYTILCALDIVGLGTPSAAGGEATAALPPLRLHEAVPNPFNPATKLSFTLADPSRATLRVHDLAGRVVRTLLADVALEAGRHEAAWDGTDDRGRPVAAGVYLCRVQAGGSAATQAVSLVK